MKPAGIRLLAAAAFFLTPIPAVAISFQNLTVTSTSPDSPYAAAFADFNSDGFPDMALLVSNGTSGAVRIFTNNGTGGFNPTTTDLATPSAPKAIVATDLNGDGKIDIAVVNTASDNVSIFLNNGNGGFPARTDVAVGIAPTAIAAGDFRGDGRRDDLAVLNSTGRSVTILLNDGTGTMTATPPANWPTSPDDLAGIAAGDFNGDNIEDIAVTRSSTGYVRIFKGNGIGTFQAGVDVTVGTSPKAAVANDFNNDGITDLAVLNGATATISIIKGTSGTFTAEAAASITNPANPAANPVDMVAADLNRDGIPDLAAISNANANIPVMTGNGNAAFTAATATEIFTTGLAAPTAIASGNLDGNDNGLLAISSTSNSYSLQSNGSAALAGITVTPPTFDFGNFQIGNVHGYLSSDIFITIANPGSVNLAVSSMTLTGTNSGDYKMLPQYGTCLTTTPAIPPGSSCTVKIQFMPTSPGTKTATFTIASNAAVNPTIQVPLSGTGIDLSSPTSINLTFTGIGSGTVSFSSWDPSCTANCIRTPATATVNLTTTPDPGMYFYGWSGCDSMTSGDCTVSMERDRRVVANFGQVPRAVKLVAGWDNYTSTVAAAYAAAASGNEIRISGVYMNENLLMNKNANVTVSGGWNGGFTAQGAPTTLHSIVVAAGSAVLDNIILQ